MTHCAEATLSRWTDGHALVMLAGTIAVATGASGSMCSVPAILSFAVLTFVFRGAWSPDGRYGGANAVTALRFLLAVALTLDEPFTPPGQALAAAVILALDGFDGWLARRYGLASRYGETLDMEVDAFFTLALCTVLYQSQRFGAWILIPGALRYLFVLGVRCAGPPSRCAKATRWSRAIGATVLSGLTLSLLPLGEWAVAIAGFVTLAVTGSFAASAWQLYRP